MNYLKVLRNFCVTKKKKLPLIKNKFSQKLHKYGKSINTALRKAIIKQKCQRLQDNTKDIFIHELPCLTKTNLFILQFPNTLQFL